MFTPLTYAQLLHIAHRSSAVTHPCACLAKPFAGWEGLPVSIKESQLRETGSLIAAEEEDLTLDEYHPDGTSYWSEKAPIAPQFFPYNRCKVCECVDCSRVYLRYAEAGAYHIEQRIRSLDPALMVDVAFEGVGRA
ncbi:hypothetical protein [Pseudomonas abietaniphila]|uniref:Uncharacterized protein n=1 Tax=Pseudomonas abietaniphila TaxID=89065 RepID=A0A1G8LWZ1_9PSED|nr:hypothetical protein [Pseudomonas abietaniphila]SDI60188.1 hypothetical protein SAMN05216605_11510 [Pseudomonas abietaniphila]